MIPVTKNNFSHMLEIALDMKKSGLQEAFIEQVMR